MKREKRRIPLISFRGRQSSRDKWLPSLLLVFLVGGCASMPSRDDVWRHRDKIVHFCASGLVAGAATEMARVEGRNRGQSSFFAFGATVFVGGGKEAYDQYIQGRAWNWGDIMWDLFGGLTGYFIATQIE